MRNPYPGFLKTFGSHMGAGLAESLLDRWFPAAPSRLEAVAVAFLNALPSLVAMVENQRESASPDAPLPQTPPMFIPLGEFTCPKCGGHTWGTLDMTTGEKYCTNGLEAMTPEYNPNTVAKPCMFRWNKASDYLYFAAPTPEDFRRTETQTCAGQVPTPSPPTPPGYVATLQGRIDDTEASLSMAVGDRRSGDETTTQAAVRLLHSADSFIAKQSKEIERLIFENEFKAGCGEISVDMSRDMAKQIGIAYEEGKPPLRVALVLSDWRWSVRVGTALIQIDWDVAEKFARQAKTDFLCVPPDATEMAQNAAGGVA